MKELLIKIYQMVQKQNEKDKKNRNNAVIGRKEESRIE